MPIELTEEEQNYLGQRVLAELWSIPTNTPRYEMLKRLLTKLKGAQ